MFRKLFFPNDEKPEHFAALDGLRGLAVLLVLFGHARLIGMSLPNFMDIGQIGVSGVHLFFVLSAYLLDRQIADNLLHHRATWHYWKNYALRRVLRIYPLFFVSLIIYWYLTSHVKGDMVFGHDIAKIDIVKHLLLQKGDGFYWSIPVEFKYYFLSPFLMLFCHYALKWDFKKILLFFLSIVVATALFKQHMGFSKISTLNYLFVFLVGTTLSIADLLQRDRLLALQEKYGKWIDIVGIIGIIVLFGSIANGFTAAYKNALLWGIVLFAAKYGAGWLRWVFARSALRIWGVVSFSAYLLHRAVLGYVHHLSPIPKKLEFVVFLLLCLLIASMTYLLIERPLSSLRLAPPRATPD